MKTTIDLVIESLTELKDEALNEAKLSRLKDEENPIADAIYMAYSIAIKETSKLKEIEKQNIITAYEYGELEKENSYTSEEYYKDTFEK